MRYIGTRDHLCTESGITCIHRIWIMCAGSFWIICTHTQIAWRWGDGWGGDVVCIQAIGKQQERGLKQQIMRSRIRILRPPTHWDKLCQERFAMCWFYIAHLRPQNLPTTAPRAYKWSGFRVYKRTCIGITYFHLIRPMSKVQISEHLCLMLSTHIHILYETLDNEHRHITVILVTLMILSRAKRTLTCQSIILGDS